MSTPEAPITVQETQRLLFCRMINDAGMNPKVSMTIVAFWMWLESQGCKELIKNISSHDVKVLNLPSIEAEFVLASLEPNSTSSTSQNLMPITSNLCQCFVSIKDKFVDKEAILKGIEDLYNNSYLMLFEDILEERSIKVDSKSNKQENRATIAKAISILMRSNKGEGPSEYGVRLGGTSLLGSSPYDRAEKLELPSSGEDGEGHQPTATLVPPTLNPFAREWNPMIDHAPKEDRCLFLTFSNKFPLTENQIFRFFTSIIYGPCVERVYVHWPNSGRDPPLFAKVMFNTSYIPTMILKGQRQRNFLVNGRPIRCKKFKCLSQRRSTAMGQRN